MNRARREIKKDVEIVGEHKEMKAQKPEAPAAIHINVSFDDWWLQAQQQYKFKPELKESVKRHFEAKGFLSDSRKYNEGLRNFGFNV